MTYKSDSNTLVYPSHNYCCFFSIHTEVSLSDSLYLTYFTSRRIIDKDKRRIVMLRALFLASLITFVPLCSNDDFNSISITQEETVSPKVDSEAFREGTNDLGDNIVGLCLLSKTDNNKVIDSKDGYLYSQTWFYASPFSDHSSVVLLKIRNSFTPGVSAYNSGLTSYNSGAHLKRGGVSVQLARYKDQDNYVFGGRIEPLFSYPSTSEVTTTLSSSFGTTLSAGVNQNQKISIGDGISFEMGTGKSGNASICFSTSTASSSSDPVIDALNGVNQNDFRWTYTCLNSDNSASKTTYSFTSYIAFEIENSSRVNCGEYGFEYTYSAFFYNQSKVWFWYKEGDKKEFGVFVRCFR